MRPPLFGKPADQGAVIRQSDPSFLTEKQLANVRILDPEIYIPPGSCNQNAKGGLTPIHTSDSIRRIKQGGGSCENVRMRLEAVIGFANHSV